VEDGVGLCSEPFQVGRGLVAVEGENLDPGKTPERDREVPSQEAVGTGDEDLAHRASSPFT